MKYAPLQVLSANAQKRLIGELIEKLTPTCPAKLSPIQQGHLGRVGMRREVLHESNWVSGLHEDGAGSGELADQPFPRRQAGDNTTARRTFEDVFAVPCYEVTVVDDVLLVLVKLHARQ